METDIEYVETDQMTDYIGMLETGEEVECKTNIYGLVDEGITPFQHIPPNWYMGVLPQNPPPTPIIMCRHLFETRAAGLIASDKEVRKEMEYRTNLFNEINTLTSTMPPGSAGLIVEKIIENEDRLEDAVNKATDRLILTGNYFMGRLVNSEIIPIIRIFSMDKKEYYLCSHTTVHTIRTITPNDYNFDMLATETAYVSLDKLTTRDIVTTTTISIDTNNPIGISTTIERADIDRFRKPLIDKCTGDDIIYYINETGMALFATKDDAEKCRRMCEGDVRRFFNICSEKDKNKKENYDFMRGLRETILVGIGTVIPLVGKVVLDKLFDKGKGK